MVRMCFVIFLVSLKLSLFSQDRQLLTFLSDSSMKHASVSLCIADAGSGEIIFKHNAERSLVPASVMKLVTTSAAIELLSPQYTFKTIIGYTGSFKKRTGRLTGNIIIQGGGDPALGSKYFSDHYNDFMGAWVTEIKKYGIKKINGRVIADDSCYDFQPVPAKWLWEDAGNYYGAGAFGLSVFDNTYEIQLVTSPDGSGFDITGISPYECRYEFSNWLVAAGTSDEGYVFAAPYSTNGWLAGTIPSNPDNFILKASIADPPSLIARMMDEKLTAAGIEISEDPTTVRLQQKRSMGDVTSITETTSPPLEDIVEVLNHESINFYAEHLIKELGRVYKNSGSTTSGIEVINDFLHRAGINTDGFFIVDGSGLSPLNAINSRELVSLMIYMKNRGKYFPEYLSSLPEAGKEGTIKNYFRDPVFDSRLKAKTGTMTRVKSYAGYFTTFQGREMIFSIIVNNYSGPAKHIIPYIEDIIREIILCQ